jgi:hypothetical protein
MRFVLLTAQVADPSAQVGVPLIAPIATLLTALVAVLGGRSFSAGDGAESELIL